MERQNITLSLPKDLLQKAKILTVRDISYNPTGSCPLESSISIFEEICPWVWALLDLSLGSRNL